MSTWFHPHFSYTAVIDVNKLTNKKVSCANCSEKKVNDSEI